MRQVVGILALTLGLVAGVPSAAHARGGNYRGPNGAVPPGLREPWDPTPPPPPPYRVSPPATPPPSAPTAPTPVPTPPARPRTRPPRAVPPGHSSTTLGYWEFWYLTNKTAFERAGQRFLGGPLLEKKVRPALRDALAPALDKTLRGAACIALARASTQAEDVLRLRMLAKAEPDLLVRESATIALGFLRRTDPALRADAAALDAARADLARILGDAQTHPQRVRSFAAVALGLLWDQPRASPASRAEHVAALFDALAASARDAQGVFEMTLAALCLVPRDDLGDAQRGVLRELVASGKLGSRALGSGTLPHAIATLGHHGTAEDVDALLAQMRSRRAKNPNVMRSAVLALATLAAHVAPDARARIADEIQGDLTREMERRRKKRRVHPMDSTAVNLATVALARIAALELRDAGGVPAHAASVGAFLRERAAGRTFDEGPYGALALGLLGRAMAAAPDEARQAWILDTRARLAAQLDDRKRLALDRGAYAAALGMIGDRADDVPLAALALDAEQHADLRAPAARALGLVAAGEPEARRTLERLLQDGRSESVRIAASEGLGALARPESAAPLVEALRRSRTQHVKGAAARALGGLGEAARAQVPALLDVLNDAEAVGYDRAYAAAALGLVVDPEPASPLARLIEGRNWRASGDAWDELRNLL